jgi:hypothetical protein
LASLPLTATWISAARAAAAIAIIPARARADFFMVASLPLVVSKIDAASAEVNQRFGQDPGWDKSAFAGCNRRSMITPLTSRRKESHDRQAFSVADIGAGSGARPEGLLAASPALLRCARSGQAPPRPAFALEDLNKVIRRALEKGGEFGEVYIEDRVSRSILLEEGKFKSAVFGISQGAGVRVISGNKTGYAYTDELTLTRSCGRPTSLPMSREAQGRQAGRHPGRGSGRLHHGQGPAPEGRRREALRS